MIFYVIEFVLIAPINMLIKKYVTFFPLDKKV